MDAIFEAYLVAQRRRRPSPLTIKAITHALLQTQRWLDERDVAVDELSLVRCEEYFDWLLERQAVSTVRRHLAYLRAAYRYGLRHDLVARDPTADVRLPRLPDHDQATYSNTDLRAIHAAGRKMMQATGTGDAQNAKSHARAPRRSAAHTRSAADWGRPST